MNKKQNCSHKRYFKVAFVFASVLLYSVLIFSLILLEKSSSKLTRSQLNQIIFLKLLFFYSLTFSEEPNKTTIKSKLNVYKLVSWIYPLSFSAKLVYVWQVNL